MKQNKLYMKLSFWNKANMMINIAIIIFCRYVPKCNLKLNSNVNNFMDDCSKLTKFVMY